VVAYDKLNGEVKWSTPSLGREGYVSPAIVKVGAEDHVVMIAASSGRGEDQTGGKVVGIDPLSGKILWEYTNWQCVIPAPSAFDAGESKVLITGGYEAGAAMIQLEKKSDGSYGLTELYKNVDFGAHTKPPLLYDGYFYSQYSTNNRHDGLVCMSMAGELMWKTGRDPGFNKGSLILADGLIFATDGDKTLYLIEPDPSGFKQLASAEVLEIVAVPEPRYGNQNWAPIALADGKLLIRDQSQIVCVKVAE
jgi:outer membrane protein assembly factor BamB